MAPRVANAADASPSTSSVRASLHAPCTFLTQTIAQKPEASIVISIVTHVQPLKR
jgi:hypothetical protein